MTDIDALYAQLEAQLGPGMGIAIMPLDGSSDPVVLGDLTTAPAWSTIKVPLAQAALDNGTAQPGWETAITASDNDAARTLWDGLGTPGDAAAAVEGVLGRYGDTSTVVESDTVRPPFTPFGQTDWSLADQTRFLADYARNNPDSPVLDMMGGVTSDRWGLGQLDGAKFKGGWGPLEGSSGTADPYLTRQMGIIDTPDGPVAVALASKAPSFDEGKSKSNAMADWISDNAGKIAYPSGTGESGRAPRGTGNTRSSSQGQGSTDKGTVEINDRAGFPRKTQAIKEAATELRAARDELGGIVRVATREAGSFTVDKVAAPVYAPALAALQRWADALAAAATSVADSADACADTAHSKFVAITDTDDSGKRTVESL